MPGREARGGARRRGAHTGGLRRAGAGRRRRATGAGGRPVTQSPRRGTPSACTRYPSGRAPAPPPGVGPGARRAPPSRRATCGGGSSSSTCGRPGARPAGRRHPCCVALASSPPARRGAVRWLGLDENDDPSSARGVPAGRGPAAGSRTVTDDGHDASRPGGVAARRLCRGRWWSIGRAGWPHGSSGRSRPASSTRSWPSSRRPDAGRGRRARRELRSDRPRAARPCPAPVVAACPGRRVRRPHQATDHRAAARDHAPGDGAGRPRAAPARHHRGHPRRRLGGGGQRERAQLLLGPRHRRRDAPDLDPADRRLQREPDRGAGLRQRARDPGDRRALVRSRRPRSRRRCTLAAIAVYVLGYTLVLKRRTSSNIVWGGAAGCMPTLIGWAAVTGRLAARPVRALRRRLLLDAAALLGPRDAVQPATTPAAGCPCSRSWRRPQVVVRRMSVYTGSHGRRVAGPVAGRGTGPLYPLGAAVLGGAVPP